MTSRDVKDLSELIRQKALDLGFDIFGIARARHLADEESALLRWTGSGMHDRMSYLARDPEKRSNPELVFSGVKSVIVAGMNYYTEKRQNETNIPLISIYALGKDYHSVITDRLDTLLVYIKSIIPGAEGRVFCDDAPVLEKPWAVEAGLGWRGKHSVIINENIGSFFFTGEIFLNTVLEYNRVIESDKCGSCRLCIDSCPTGAINEDRNIDARKCIANLTTSNKSMLTEEIIPLMGRRLYSCDTCQEVCPWNRVAKPHSVAEFNISDELANMTKEEWLSLDIERFNRLFGYTAVARVRYDRFKKNIEAISGNLPE